MVKAKAKVVKIVAEEESLEHPPLPPIETLPIELELESEEIVQKVEKVVEEEEESIVINNEAEGEGKDEVEAEQEKEPVIAASVAGVHKGKDDWTAVWSQESNSYYFWNSKTNVTTWENPLTIPSASTSSLEQPPLPPSSELPPQLPTKPDLYNGIDPDLAYLDPSLAYATSSTGPSFKARFNSRTGRFQGDPSMNPDRISDYSRGNRQQEAFYDTTAWQESLGGRGIKRSGESITDVEGGGEEGGGGERKKRPSAKEVAQFKQNKIDKKRRNLTAFLA